jgi:hypothetical protein
MVDPRMWALMQRVETYRYYAERVERAGAHWPAPWNALAADIALQWRELADQVYALAAERELEAAGPPPWR